MSRPQADYGAGLYKAGELDERMGYEAIVHREIEGHESTLFKNYFNVITYVRLHSVLEHAIETKQKTTSGRYQLEDYLHLFRG